MDTITEIPELDGWIPIRFYWKDAQPMVDWCYFGSQGFTEPFFDQTLEGRLRTPFNLLFRHQTPISVLHRRNEIRPGLRPTGFVFHLSRCGSTLITQMLASLSRSIVISEAGPIDAIVRAQVSDDSRIDWLRWLISALAQPRTGSEEFFFVKFDAWSILDLPLIRCAFPDVPWLFVYRDPIEVLVSQFRQRSAHTIPGVIDPRLFGMDLNLAISLAPEEYCARVLASLCEAALQYRHDGGQLISYRQLPDAVWSIIPETFKLPCTEADYQKMRGVAKLHAKNPFIPFEEDSAKKNANATLAIRTAADRWLYPVYERLEQARLENASATKPL